MAKIDLDDYEVPTEEPVSNYDTLPAGDYVMQLIEALTKDTRNRDGRILALTWEVTEGDDTSRRVFQNINYKNPSQKAQEIGRRELDEVTYATGITSLEDTDDLLWIPCLVRIKVVPAKNDYPAKNEVVSVKRYAGQAAPAPRTNQQQRQQPARQPAPANTPRQAQASRPPAGGSGNRPWPASR